MEKLTESETYNSEICCIALSGYGKIQLVCQPHNDYLKLEFPIEIE